MTFKMSSLLKKPELLLIRVASFLSPRKKILKEAGILETGKKMDLLLCDLPNYPHLVYHLAINPIPHVIKNGKIVVKDGRRIEP